MQFLRSLGFILLIVAVFAVVVFAAVRWVPVGSYPGDSFFDLAAQTIPILLVALAVEAQARQFDLERTGRRIRIAAVILLALGEIAAILVSASLFTPDPGVVSDIFVVTTAAGLLGGFLAVIVVAVRTTGTRTTATTPEAVDSPPALSASVPRPAASRDRISLLSALAVLLLGAALGSASRPR